MASREKKSGGDFVLESRHLVGLFMLLVVIFGVVFTLGYLLGRSQYDTKVLAPPVYAGWVSMCPRGPPSAKSKNRPESEDAQVPKKIPTGISITPPIRKRPLITCSRH